MAMADERDDDDAQKQRHGDGSFTNRDDGAMKGRRDAAMGEKMGSDEGFSERVFGFVERYKALQEDASLHASRSQSKDNALGRQAMAILAEIKRLRAALVVYCERDELQPDVADQVCGSEAALPHWMWMSLYSLALLSRCVVHFWFFFIALR